VNNVVSGVAFNVNSVPGVTTSYTLVSVSDANGCVRSSAFTGGSTSITVRARPTAVLTGTQVICADGTAVLNVSLTGVAPFVVTLSDGTQRTFSSTSGTISVTPNAATTYTIVSVSDASCSAQSGDITGSAAITLNTPVVITQQPASSAVICAGSSTLLSVSATGTGLGYQWYKDGVLIAINGTSATYTATASGNYYVVVSGACNSVTSAQTAVSVNPLPQGSLSGSVVCAGSTSGATLTYTSSVAGTGPYTLVYNDGVANRTVNNVVSGVAFNVNSVPGVTTSYTLVSVSDANGCVRSSAFTGGSTSITVRARPTAVLTGTQVICADGTAVLNVSLTGVAPFVVTLSDGTQRTFSSTSGTISVTPNAATTYTIVSVSDASCSAQSGDITGSAAVTLNTPVVITQQPVSYAVICAGSTTTLSVATNTATDLSYQWFRDGVSLIGRNADTLTITLSGSYYVLVKGACGNVASSVSVVAQNPLPQGRLSGSIICSGGTAMLTYTSSVAGTGPYNIRITDGTTVQLIENVVSGVPFEVTQLTNTTNYTLVSITDANGCVRATGFTTATATVTVRELPRVSVNPANITISAGGVATFQVSALGTALRYQWQVSVDGGSTYTNIAATAPYEGVITPQLKVNSVTLRMNQYSYRVIVSGACPESVVSNAATLTVISPTASFTVNSRAQCLNGNEFKFQNTSKTNVGTLTYAWTFGDGIGKSAQENPVYTYGKAGTYIAKLVVTTGTGDKDSSFLTINVSAKPQPDFSIDNARQCLTNNVFRFRNTTPMSDSSAAIFGYKWDFGDNSVSTDINPSKSYARSGIYQVKLIVTTINGCTDSIIKSVTVDTIPVASISSSQGQIVCEGSSLVLNATGGATYEWYRDGVLLAGVNGASFSATSAGVYNVRAISSRGCVSTVSNTLTLTLLNKPKADFDFDSYCINRPVTFINKSLVSNSGPISYQWTDSRGNTSTNASPVFSYTTSGVVTMKLKVTPQVCTSIADSITRTINIEAPRQAIRMPFIDAIVSDPIKLQARNFGTSYLWSPGKGLTDSTVVAPTAVLTAPQQYNITISVASGCQTVDTLFVRVFNNYSVFVPNVFTPNGDGQNDQLLINLIGIKQVKYFRIYNKAGKKVFESNDPNQRWDGKLDGVLQPLDSYMWVIEAVSNSGNALIERGVVTLLR
jgi:gliding motility-associated-like protein